MRYQFHQWNVDYKEVSELNGALEKIKKIGEGGIPIPISDDGLIKKHEWYCHGALMRVYSSAGIKLPHPLGAVINGIAVQVLHCKTKTKHPIVRRLEDIFPGWNYISNERLPGVPF